MLFTEKLKRKGSENCVRTRPPVRRRTGKKTIAAASQAIKVANSGASILKKVRNDSALE